MKLKPWEIGLCLGMILLVLGCAIPVYQQERLADKLTRLHVVANSDDAADQALKLRVRDAVEEPVLNPNARWVAGPQMPSGVRPLLR